MTPPPSATMSPPAAPAVRVPLRSPTIASSRRPASMVTNRIAIETVPSRTMSLLALAFGLTIVFLGFVAGLTQGGDLPAAVGRGLLAPVLPTALASVVGWRNERRARLAFVVIGCAIVPLLLLQILSATAV